MSDSDFHRLVFGSTIEEPPKTTTLSCRLEVDLYSDVAAIAQHFGTTKTFVVQTLLKSALADFFSTLDQKHCSEIQGLSEAFFESFSQEN